MLTFAAFGASIGSWAGSIPTITDASATGNFSFGVMLTVSTLATIIGMGLGGPIGRQASNRHVLLLALPLLSLLTAALLLSSSFWVLAAALVGFGFFLGVTDLFMNAEASAIEHDLARPIFSTFHAVVSFAVAVCAISASLTTVLAGPALTALIAAMVHGAAWLAVHAHVPARKPLASLSAGPRPRLTNPLPLIVMGLAVGAVIAAETATMLWSAKLLNEGAPQLAALAGAGAAFFALCNAIMRFAGDRLRSLFGDGRVMLTSLALSFAAFLALGFNLGFAANVVAFAAVGLGVALISPCLFSRAAAHVPGNRAAGLGFMSAIAGLPRVAAPWVFGWLATAQSTSLAFGFCAVAIAAAFGLIFWLERQR